MTKASYQRLAVFYSAFLVVLVVAAGQGALPLELIARLPGGDKTGHFLLMGLLSFIVNLAFTSRSRFTVVWRSLQVAFVVTLEEFSQVALRYRRFEPADLAADLAGITVFALLAVFLLSRRTLRIYDRDAKPSCRSAGPRRRRAPPPSVPGSVDTPRSLI